MQMWAAEAQVRHGRSDLEQARGRRGSLDESGPWAGPAGAGSPSRGLAVLGAGCRWAGAPCAPRGDAGHTVSGALAGARPVLLLLIWLRLGEAIVCHHH